MFFVAFIQLRRFFAAHILILVCGAFTACSEKKESGAGSGGGETYYHPSVATSPTTSSTTGSTSTHKDLSLTEDVVLELGTTKVTIPKGAVHELGTAVLQSYTGPFVNTSFMRMVTESMLLILRKADASDFARTEIFKDIIIEQTTETKTASTKMVQLFQENAQLSTATKTGLTQKLISTYYSDQGSGKYKMGFRVRPSRLAFVVAEVGGGALPLGFTAFVEPPRDPTVVAASATSPADVTLTWSADPRFNVSYGVVYYAAGETEPDCKYDNVVSATTTTTITSSTTSADYTLPVSGLLDGTSYTFKVCGLSSRVNADSSGGTSVTITTPDRAEAVLTGAPSDPSKTTALDITVGGANVIEYQYALLTDQTSCSAATFSAWIPVATKITDAIPEASGTKLLCVLGKIDETNLQLISTDVLWTVDKTPPTFTSLDLAAPALDGYLSTVDRALTTVIAGTLTAVEHNPTATTYIIVSSAVTCDSALSYGVAPGANDAGITVDGTYKICAKILDYADNDAYGSSANFVVDTTISFSTATLANQATDTYINLADSALTGDLVSTATGAGFTSAQYALVSAATTCDVAVTYGASIPKSNDAVFTTDGDYVVCVDLSDLAGNHAYGSSATIHLKKTAPAFTSMALLNEALDGYINIADHLLTNPIAATAVGTSYDTVNYAVQAAVSACSAVVSWSGSIPLANSASIVANGNSYKVCARLSDNAGNTPAYGSTSNFLYDATAPTFTSLARANGATDGYLNSAEIAAALAVTGVTSPAGAATETYALVTSATSCNASLTYAAGLITAGNAGFAADVAYKVCVRLTDLAGNITYGASSSITRMTTVPDCTGISLANDAVDDWINIAENATTNTLASASTTNLASPVKTYALIASAATCDSGASFGGLDVIPQSDNVGLVNGSSYKICGRVTDAANNTPAYCATTAFTVDLTSPVFTSLPLANTAIDLYVNIADHALTSAVAGPLTGSGYTAEGYVIAGSGVTCDGLLTYGATIPTADAAALAVSGIYKICVKLNDAAGNITYNESSTFTSDQIAPVFTSFDLANEASDGYINLAESISVLDGATNLIASGQATTEYAVLGSAAACSSGTFAGTIPTVAETSAGADGNYKLCVHLVDVAGNETYGSTSAIALDKTVPVFTSIALAGDAVGDYVNAVERTHNTAIVGTAAGTGHDTTHYALVSSGTVCSAVGVWSTSLPASDSADFALDGDYIVCVKLADYAGNPTVYGSTSDIHLKTDYPVFTSIDLANDVVDAYLNAAEHALTNPLATNLSAAGYATATYGLTTSAGTCNGSVTYGAMPLDDDALISGANDFKVCVSLVDIAGNITYGSGSPFTYDPTAPVFTSLALANDVADGYLNSAEHLLTNALAGSLTGSGYSTAEYVVVTSATTCNNILTYGAMPQSSDAAITDAGTWKVCVKLTDLASNSTYGGTVATFQSEYTAPGFTSVSLTAVASDGFVNAADSTASTDLITAATGTSFDAASYVVTTSATACDDNLVYSSTIPKTDNAGLSSDGTYKVCAKLTDLSGNTPAFGGSGTFVRDVTKPTSAVTTSGSVLPSTTPGANTTVAGTASDAEAGVASIAVSIQEASGSCYAVATNDFSAVCPAWLAATGTTSWTYDIPDNALLKGVIYTVQVRATDLALSGGNVQTTLGSGTFTYTAAEGDDLWTQPIVYDGGSGADKPLGAAVDGSGNIFVVGYHTATDKNWLIKKFDKRGNEDTTQWNKDVGDVGSEEIAQAVAIDTSENVYVVGSRHNGVNLDWWLKKYSSTGTEDLVNWDIILDGGTGDDEATAAAVDTSGNIYVVGYGTNIAGVASGKDAWIRKYSSAGVLGCEQKIDGGANLDDGALSVAVNSSTAKLYVSGYQTAAGPDQQMVIRRLRTSDCTIEVTVTGNSAGISDQAASLRLDSAGNVYVAGRNGTTDSDWWIRKYSSALALQTDFSTGIAGSHEGLAVGIDASNNIYVGGYQTNATQDWWLRQFSTTLVEDTVQWNKVVDGNSAADQVTALVIGTAVDDLGSVYTIGWGTNIDGGATGADWWIRKYAAP